MDPKTKKNVPFYNDDLIDNTQVSSSGDCTGLIPADPANEDEAEAYSELYDIPHSESRKKK